VRIGQETLGETQDRRERAGVARPRPGAPFASRRLGRLDAPGAVDQPPRVGGERNEQVIDIYAFLLDEFLNLLVELPWIESSGGEQKLGDEAGAGAGGFGKDSHAPSASRCASKRSISSPSSAAAFAAAAATSRSRCIGSAASIRANSLASGSSAVIAAIMAMASRREAEGEFLDCMGFPPLSLQNFRVMALKSCRLFCDTSSRPGDRA